MFTNDKFSDGNINFNSSEWIKTVIENDVLIGSNATILPVNICSHVVLDLVLL